MCSPFPSSYLSFLPLQSVLYFSVSSSACPNSQRCFPTFSLSQNTLWRHSLNFPFDFFIAFPLKSDSQLFLPGPPYWGLLENLLFWGWGEKDPPFLMSCLPCFPPAILSPHSLPTSPAELWGHRFTWVWIPTLPFTTFETLAKLLNSVKIFM